MSIKKEVFAKLLEEMFPKAVFEITDTRGDEDHYRVKISSNEFHNMTRLQKHRVVNSRLKDYLGTVIHAVEFIIE